MNYLRVFSFIIIYNFCLLNLVNRYRLEIGWPEVLPNTEMFICYYGSIQNPISRRSHHWSSNRIALESSRHDETLMALNIPGFCSTLGWPRFSNVYSVASKLNFKTDGLTCYVEEAVFNLNFVLSRFN